MRESTRIWWDGSLVQFIRWSDKGLVFNWDDPRETAIHMPRGTVMRLMEKGVLRIEGDAPEWTQANIQPVQLDAQRQPSSQLLPKEHTPPAPKIPNKLNIIARLIHKLGGGDNDPARAAS
jgi:hypothetical protein